MALPFFFGAIFELIDKTDQLLDRFIIGGLSLFDGGQFRLSQLARVGPAQCVDPLD